MFFSHASAATVLVFASGTLAAPQQLLGGVLRNTAAVPAVSNAYPIATTILTTDGSCGNNLGGKIVTCLGNGLKTCCGKTSICGLGDDFCGTGCNPLAGNCDSASGTVNRVTGIFSSFGSGGGALNSIGSLTSGAGGASNLVSGASNTVGGLTTGAGGASNVVGGATNTVGGLTTGSGGASNLVSGTTNTVGGLTNGANGASNVVSGATKAVGGATNTAGGATGVVSGLTGAVGGALSGVTLFFSAVAGILDYFRSVTGRGFFTGTQWISDPSFESVSGADPAWILTGLSRYLAYTDIIRGFFGSGGTPANAGQYLMYIASTAASPSSSISQSFSRFQSGFAAANPSAVTMAFDWILTAVGDNGAALPAGTDLSNAVCTLTTSWGSLKSVGCFTRSLKDLGQGRLISTFTIPASAVGDMVVTFACTGLPNNVEAGTLLDNFEVRTLN